MRRLLLAVLALPMAVALWGAAAAEASFPGVNGKIAFSRVVDTPVEARCVYTANANGTAETVLLPPCDGDQESNPRWSPDGAQIAYQGYGGQIDLVNQDGTNLREFFFDSGVGTTGFGWSPDGTEIAVSWFDCFDGLPCGSRIEKLNSTTGAYTTILTTEDFVSGADWSPDGTFIAFTRQFQIHVIRPDGTGLAQVAPGSPGDNHSPSWSPNAQKIAFVSSRDGNQEIYVMNADGTAQTRLTDNTSFEGSPRWSPDGTKIIFETDRDDDQEIYVMDANGSNQTRVTNALGYDSAPDWQADSGFRLRATQDGDVGRASRSYPPTPHASLPTGCTGPRSHPDRATRPPGSPPNSRSAAPSPTGSRPISPASCATARRDRHPRRSDDADVAITVQLTDVIRHPKQRRLRR